MRSLGRYQMWLRLRGRPAPQDRDRVERSYLPPLPAGLEGTFVASGIDRPVCIFRHVCIPKAASCGPQIVVSTSRLANGEGLGGLDTRMPPHGKSLATHRE